MGVAGSGRAVGHLRSVSGSRFRLPHLHRNGIAYVGQLNGSTQPIREHGIVRQSPTLPCMMPPSITTVVAVM
jgi:hypothetical protein